MVYVIVKYNITWVTAIGQVVLKNKKLVYNYVMWLSTWGRTLHVVVHMGQDTACGCPHGPGHCMWLSTWARTLQVVVHMGQDTACGCPHGPGHCKWLSTWARTLHVVIHMG